MLTTDHRPPTTALAFRRRAKCDEIDTSKRRHWYSLCGRYRVTELRSKFGLPTVYLAMRLDARLCWDIVDRRRHFKPGPAFAACTAAQRAEALTSNP